MCLAIPAKVIELDTQADHAKVSLNGVCVDVSLALVENVAVGDYVLVHVGYALNKICPQEAETTLAMFAESGLLDGHQEQNP